METKIEIQGIKEALEKYDSKKVVTAARSAINKTAQQTRTYAAKIIREDFNVQAGRVNQFLKVSAKASGDELQAIITGRGRGMALSYFGPRQEGVQVSKKAGFRYTRKAKGDGRKHGGVVTVEVRRGHRKVVSGDPKPYLTVFKSGHIAVMQRTGRGRPKQLLGPGVGGLLGSRLFMPRIESFAKEKFIALFNHELEWRLK